MDYVELAVDRAVDVLTASAPLLVPRVAAANALEWAKSEFDLSPEWLFHVERALEQWASEEESLQAQQEEIDWQNFLYDEDDWL